MSGGENATLKKKSHTNVIHSRFLQRILYFVPTIWFDLVPTELLLCEAISSSLADLKWLIMFAAVRCIYDSTHLVYPGRIIKAACTAFTHPLNELY